VQNCSPVFLEDSEVGEIVANVDNLHAIVEPIVGSLDADIYDLEFTNNVLKVTLDRPGGIDLETVAEATRQISRQIDLDDPIPGKFTLEVTSPGLERTLRTSEHWVRSVGDTVRVKATPDFEGERRFEGVVSGVEGDVVTLDVDGTPVSCRLSQIDRARTVFVWGPQPKPGKQPKAVKPPAAINESENS